MNREELIGEAFKAIKNSYAPYSKYHGDGANSGASLIVPITI
jgi:Cytidine deaminase